MSQLIECAEKALESGGFRVRWPWVWSLLVVVLVVAGVRACGSALSRMPEEVITTAAVKMDEGHYGPASALRDGVIRHLDPSHEEYDRAWMVFVHSLAITDCNKVLPAMKEWVALRGTPLSKEMVQHLANQMPQSCRAAAEQVLVWGGVVSDASSDKQVKSK